MKKLKRLLLILAAEMTTSITGFALPPDSLTGAKTHAELLKGNILSETQFDTVNPLLMPDYDAVRAVFNKNSAELKPSLLAESLYLYKKTSAFDKSVVLNALVSISALAGIKYYSASRKTMRVFYEESSVINDPKQKIPQPDPVFNNEVPARFTLYARQKDLSFGDNVYRYDYIIDDNAIIFTQTNYTPLVYSIIPAVPKEKLRVIAAVIDADDYFLIYAASMAKVPSLPVINKKAGASFASRAEALIKWFTQSLSR
ncbi:MAG: hypothetical protein LBC27_08650 [Spirochaetaceae bacterium]|jgi:hypothetical protein|nr:hypothetical protein [Spirochaetaceae bacterium]